MQGIVFYHFAIGNTVVDNVISEVSEGVLLNSIYRGPTAWNLVGGNVVENVYGRTGGTATAPVGIESHFRVRVDEWPAEDDRYGYSLGNMIRLNTVSNSSNGVYVGTSYGSYAEPGSPDLDDHPESGMQLSIIENNILYTNSVTNAVVTDTFATEAFINGNIYE